MSYEDLIVWQKAIDLCPRVYHLVKRFPREETYALADQVRRAVVSVPANIAEGQARQHRKEFVQFLATARGSLAELKTLLIVARKLNYINDQELQTIQVGIDEVGKLINGLMSNLRKTSC